MMHKAFIVPLAAVACASVPPAATSLADGPRRALPAARSFADATRSVPPAVVEPTVRVVPVAAASAAPDVWSRLQTHLPTLRGADPQLEFDRVGAYAPERDAQVHWRQLAAALDAGGLAGTCAGSVPRFLALLVDDPTRASSIGRPEARIFWMPLAAVAPLTIAEAIRSAGLVDGLEAEAHVRSLRPNRDRASWIDAVERSPAWFLPAGDDRSIHPRRIRGYAVAELAQLRPYLVHIGSNTIGDFCEVATSSLPNRAELAIGPVRRGDDPVCMLAGVSDLPECAR